MKEALEKVYKQQRLMLSMSHYQVHTTLLQQRILGKVYDIRSDLNEALLQLTNMEEKLEKVREHVGAAPVVAKKSKRPTLPIEEEVEDTPETTEALADIQKYLMATVSELSIHF